MKSKSHLLLIVFTVLSFFVAQASFAAIPSDKTAQLEYKPADLLESDPQVRTGKLQNGLTYYIRTNKKPEKRAELRLVVNVGSVLEEDDEQGLAHFVEHMAFAGTKNFPKHELVNYLESIGMRFGPELNGYTGFDQTVYMLEVPTDNLAVLEKAFLILEDWAHRISFNEAQIDKERGVILEEWRSGRGAQARMRDQQLPVIFQGSRYAHRPPIGQTDIIKSFPYQKLRDFYKRWYRPDLMSIVAVGDFDQTAVEQMISGHLSDIARPGDVPARDIIPVPDHGGTLFAPATDPEATATSVSVLFKKEPAPTSSIQNYKTRLVEHLYDMLLNQRLYELSRRPDPPFIYGYSTRTDLVRSKEAYMIGAVVKDNGVEEGLEAVLTEISRIKKYGFNKSELDRQKEEFQRGLEQACKEKDKTESSVFVSPCINHYLNGDPILSIEYRYNLAKQLLPAVTLDEVNAVVNRTITENNRVITLNAPEKQGFTVPGKDELIALFAKVEGKDVVAYKDKIAGRALIEAPPQAGRILADKRIESLGLTEWTLSNGIRVVLKPTDFQNEEILLGSFSPGGSSLIDKPDYPSAIFAISAITESGLNVFDKIELEKMLAGKLVNVSPWIGELNEGISGSCTPQDLETMFQLVYLYFTAPRMDEPAFGSFRQRLSQVLRHRDTSPETAFRDTVQLTLGQNHYRSEPLTEGFLGKVDLSKAFEIYRNRFADASDFTFILVGNFDVESLRPTVEEYLGGLPVVWRKEQGKDTGMDYPRGIVEKQVFKGLEPKSLVQLAFTGPFEWTSMDRYRLRSLTDLLRIKMRQSLREDKGECYGVGISSAPSRDPRPSYIFNVGFACAPERVEEMTQLVFKEVEGIKNNGVPAGDIEKIKEMQTRELETRMKENDFWLEVLSHSYRFQENPEDILEYDQKIRSLKAEDIKSAALKYLDEKNYVRVVLYPEADRNKEMAKVEAE
ncbi:MAG: insulinase family protein [Pseudomonadota bacterium]